MDELSPAAARRLRLATRAILAIGFAAALAVYIFAAARPDDPLADQLNSKKYLHDLEVYGGKANVLAAEFREWFAGIWYGKSLAGTIAVLTVVLVGIVRFLAIPLPSAEEEDVEEPDPPPPNRPRRL